MKNYLQNAFFLSHSARTMDNICYILIHYKAHGLLLLPILPLLLIAPQRCGARLATSRPYRILGRRHAARPATVPPTRIRPGIRTVFGVRNIIIRFGDVGHAVVVDGGLAASGGKAVAAVNVVILVRCTGVCWRF